MEIVPLHCASVTSSVLASPAHSADSPDCVTTKEEVMLMQRNGTKNMLVFITKPWHGMFNLINKRKVQPEISGPINFEEYGTIYNLATLHEVEMGLSGWLVRA